MAYTKTNWVNGTTPANDTNMNKIENELESLDTSVSGIVDKIYPVGSIYMSVNSTSPADLFGGTWEQLKDRFLLGAGDTYTNGATGGEAEHTLTIDEMPKHSHKLLSNTPQGSSDTISILSTYQGSDENATIRHSSDVGGSEAHNNMPPFLVVYMWRRTK